MDLDYLLSILSTILGWIILGCVCGYAIPQFVKVIKTKNTTGLSIPAFIFFSFSCVCMLCWGIGNALRSMEKQNTQLMWVLLILVPNMILNTLNSFVNITCLVIKIIHVRKAKKLGIDEYELSKRLLREQIMKKGVK